MAKKKAKISKKKVRKVTKKKAKNELRPTAEIETKPKVFDGRLDELKALMRLKPSLEDTAAFFQCAVSTVTLTIRDEFGLTFRQFRDQNFVHTRLQLQRDALTKSKVDWNAHKFCLENFCGWGSNRNVEHSGNEDRPIQVKKVDLEERIKQLEEGED